jgi:hypothetical protein
LVIIEASLILFLIYNFDTIGRSSKIFATTSICSLGTFLALAIQSSAGFDGTSGSLKEKFQDLS